MDKKKVTFLVTRRLLPATGLVGLGLLLSNLATVGVVMERSYHFIRNTPKTGAIQINIYDGTRQRLQSTQEVLVRVIDGNQKEVVVKFLKGGSIRVENLEFHDNFGDRYTVLVSSKGFKQAGYFPVKLRRGDTVPVDLMLLPNNYRLNFDEASWGQLKVRMPAFHSMVSSGLSDHDARLRWEKLLAEKPLVAAHLLNVGGALVNLEVSSGEAILPFYKEIVFDATLTQGNLFGWADKRLIAELRNSVSHGRTWDYAAGSPVFHPGNTASFKELSFYEANVQITAYEQTTRIINGVECVRIETDIDYYRDPAAHIILEVFPNTFGGRMTNPLEVYQLRFIASRTNGVGTKFEPPYKIEATK
jgi:hypothetical protein